MSKHHDQYIDIRPALILATVQDEERRRKLMVVSSAIDGPQEPEMPVTGLGIIVLAGLCLLGLMLW